MTLPERANYSLTESALSPFPAEPAHTRAELISLHEGFPQPGATGQVYWCGLSVLDGQSPDALQGGGARGSCQRAAR